MEMINKKWYLYMLKAYKIQSIVLFITVLLFYVYLCLHERQNQTLGDKAFGGPMFGSIIIFLYFEFILIPINTLFLEILKRIKHNRIIIYTNKSIAVFAVLYELIWGINIVYLPVFSKSIWIMLLIDCLFICIIIIILNVIAIILKKCKCFKK